MPWPPTTHQHVEDEIDAGQGWAATLSERFNMGEQLIPSPIIWVVGQYHGSFATASTSTATVAPTANLLRLAPIYLPQSRAVDQIACNVSTAGTAGHVARMGIYNASATTGLPTTVKVDAGTVAVDSTGIKTLTLTSVTLNGLYWLAITAQSGTFTGYQSNTAAAVGGVASVTGTTENSLSRASTVPTSALPNLTGDSTVVLSSLVCPRALVRGA